MIDAFLVGCRHRNCSLLPLPSFSHWQTDRTGQSCLFMTTISITVDKVKENTHNIMKAAFWCCDNISKNLNWNVPPKATERSWYGTEIIKYPAFFPICGNVTKLQHKRRIKTPHKTWNVCSGFQNNRTKKQWDLLICHGLDVALALFGSFPLKWSFPSLYHVYMLIIIMSGEWKLHWKNLLPLFFH